MRNDMNIMHVMRSITHNIMHNRMHNNKHNIRHSMQKPHKQNTKTYKNKTIIQQQYKQIHNWNFGFSVHLMSTNILFKTLIFYSSLVEL